MYDFEEFVDRVKEEVEKSLPTYLKDADVVISDVKKIGETYSSIGINKLGKNEPYPVANLTRMFEDYQKGIPIEAIVSKIEELVYSPSLPIGDIEFLKSYDQMKKRLFVRLCNAKENELLLKEIPHRMISDLAMSYHICIRSSGTNFASATIDYTALANLGISEEQLHEDALRNSVEVLIPVVKPAGDMIGISSDLPMQVITDTIRINGSSVIMYPEVRRELTEFYGGDFLIIPSSIHEILAYPFQPERIAEFNSMVRLVNEHVDQEDRLSDHVYVYDSRNDRILSINDVMS